MDNVLLENISCLVSLAPLGTQQKVTHIAEQDLGMYQNAWVFIQQGKISHIGSEAIPNEILKTPHLKKIDAAQKLVLPGFVDSHTHPIFAGNRAHEFKQRLDGSSYQDIAKNGGGIAYTVNETRKASSLELEQSTLKHLQTFLSLGVTTLEVKSGYGLSVEEELRHLKVLNGVKTKTPQQVKITCLALHALHQSYNNNAEYIELISQQLLPQIEKHQLADYVDAFIEDGYFSAEECNAYFEQAKTLGLGVRVHADEFTDSGGGEAAAKWGAASADHLQYVSAKSLEHMAKANVVATILPGTSLYTSIPFANGRNIIDKGCPLAIASDFNPGSCLLQNLAQLGIVAGLQSGLKSWEIISALTFVPAYSLGLSRQKGALAPGFDADFVIYEHDSFAKWLADMGQSQPEQVWIKGKLVAAKSH